MVDAVILQNDLLLPRHQRLRDGRMLLECARHGAVPGAQTQTDDSLNRRGRAWLGYPRAGAHSLTVSVNARPTRPGKTIRLKTELSECI